MKQQYRVIHIKSVTGLNPGCTDVSDLAAFFTPYDNLISEVSDNQLESYVIEIHLLKCHEGLNLKPSEELDLPRGLFGSHSACLVAEHVSQRMSWTKENVCNAGQPEKHWTMAYYRVLEYSQKNINLISEKGPKLPPNPKLPHRL